MMYPCKVLSGNRITIPKQIMKDLNLKVGDLVIRTIEGNRLYFTPCKVVEL